MLLTCETIVVVLFILSDSLHGLKPLGSELCQILAEVHTQVIFLSCFCFPLSLLIKVWFRFVLGNREVPVTTET